jgi:hypothetical protein
LALTAPPQCCVRATRKRAHALAFFDRLKPARQSDFRACIKSI